MQRKNERLRCTAMVRVAGVFKTSQELMTSMNNAMKLPELQATMRDMQRGTLRSFNALLSLLVASLWLQAWFA
jgi:hypothetical protein